MLRASPIAGMLLLVAGAWPAAGRAAQAYEGLAYARGSERLLYRESHWVDGGAQLVLYRCADGKPFARKRLQRSANASSPDFEMLDARTGYREGVRSAGRGREVYTQASARAAVRRAPLDAARTVVDAGFDDFVRGAWDRLGGKGGIDMAFLVPSRLDAMDFTVREVARDAARRTFRLSLGAWYGAVLPHIDVDYAIADKRLLRYRGMSNIRDARGRNLDVDIRFPTDKRRPASAADMDAAAAQPLVERCAS